MRATEKTGPDRFDVDLIMRKGRRLRHRRWAVRSGVAALSVAAVVGLTIGLLPGREPFDQGTQPEPAATATAPTPDVETPQHPPTAAPVPPIGDVVTTGIRYGDDERVFYFVAVELPEAPEVTIGLAAARRALDGSLTVDFLLNDFAGSDRSPGFHQIGYEPSDELLPAVSMPTFGYFVGPATRIVGTIGDSQVTARLAPWSDDPAVVVFWFDPQSLTPGQRLDGIAAYDAQGQRL
ncbi:hypothetical protein [Micromonospora sp. NBC_01813]|uniref:hypothetical protein n=1 Tax=Micromonospora sp. NBC_01813 TaxID=2975988 RepID=UPI002DD90BFD|nr:hypothetical protein [Micromonospora sp. NBC_01813]WSA08790.1 hypothetical protein OG958_32275 [Micromonospora sp. NBC_01813]